MPVTALAVHDRRRPVRDDRAVTRAEPTDAVSTTIAPAPTVELRPKRAWRIVNAGLLALAVYGTLVGREANGVLLVAATAMWTASACRDYLAVIDGVLYRRGVFKWSDPFDLRDVTSVSLRYRAFIKDVPHLVLWLWAGRRLEMVSLRWWDDPDALLREVAFHVSEPVDGQPNYRRFRVELDDKSARRLAEYL